MSLCVGGSGEGDPAVPVLPEIGDRALLDCASAEALEEPILQSAIDPSIATHRDLMDQDQECADAYELMCDAVDESAESRIRLACSG